MAKIATPDKTKRYNQIAEYVAKEHKKVNTNFLDAKLSAAKKFGVCQTTVERALRATSKTDKK